MPALLLKFVVRLGDYPPASHPVGPQFARWLPNGEQDALVLEAEDPDATLTVWFERRGFVDGQFIRFDASRRDVDPDIMQRQVPLQAGHLFGKVTYRDVAPDTIAALQGGPGTSELYQRFGKRLIRRTIYPGVSRLLSTLRANYGQYWLPELDKWDSRDVSLGAYCSSLNLQWSIDDGASWTPFRPDFPAITIRASMGADEPEYLTQVDWSQLPRVLSERTESSVAAQTLTRAHGFADRDDLRAAYIEGVTALELAIAEATLRNLPNTTDIRHTVERFYRLQLSARVLVAAGLVGGVDSSQLEGTLRAIGRRAQIVHRGVVPSLDDDVRADLRALLRTAARFISGPPFRFPSARGGMRLGPPTTS